MRVLFVARWYPSHDAPGRGSFVADQVRALRRAGADIVVASWEPAIIRSAHQAMAIATTWAATIARSGLLLATPSGWGAGVPVVRLSAPMPADPDARQPLDLANLQAATLVPFGVALARAWPFDVIHAHTGLPDGVSASVLADRIGVPIVTTEHDGSLDVRLADSRSREAYARLIGEGRRLLAVSPRLAAQMAELAGLPVSAITVVPNLVELDHFRPEPTIQRRPEELLWVGNRKSSKGMDALIRAFAALTATHPNARLRLIGQAPTDGDEARLRSLADELAVADRISFEPPGSRAEVAAAMSRADLFVHPSPRESFGIVAVEALASGLPVVAVAPAIIDLIGRDGRLGEVSDGPEPEALAAAIRRALVRRAGFDSDVLVAAAQPYAADTVAARILSLYQAIVPGPGHVGPADVVDGAQHGPPSALVVASRRRVAEERIAALHPEAARHLTVVTTMPPGGPELEPDPRWVGVDADADFRAGLERLGLPAGGGPRLTGLRRWLEILFHPLRTRARRRLFAERESLAGSARAAALAATDRSLGGRLAIIALDADDVLTVQAAGLTDRLVAVGLRWIADRHDGATTDRRPPT